MNHTYFAHITATNFEELLTSINTAKHDGLELSVEAIENSYFLEHIRNTASMYSTLDYVPWRGIRWVAFIEIDIKAIALEDRERAVRYATDVGLKEDKIKPSHVTDNVYIVSVNQRLKTI